MLLLTFGAAVVLAAVVGFGWARFQGAGAQHTVLADLNIIADLKTRELSAWLGERRSDARLLAENPRFGEALAEVIATGKPPSSGPLVRFLGTLMRVYAYESLYLVDANGRFVFGMGPAPAAGSIPVGLIAQVIKGGDIHFTDLRREHPDKDAPVILDIVAPLIQTADGAPVGAAVLRITAASYLFPSLADWPLRSASAEFALLRREGEGLLHLYGQRHDGGAILAMPVPLAERGLLSVQAVLSPGDPVEGADYRGSAVIGVSRVIEPLGWILLAKVDKADFLAPVHRSALYLGGFVFLLFAGAGCFLTMRSTYAHRAYEQRLRLERLEREALERHFEYATKHARDIVLLIDEAGRIVECNDAALAAYGYTHEELLRRPAVELRIPETRATLEQDLEQARRTEGSTYETIHQRKDGSSFPVENSQRLIEIGGRRYYHAVVRDISERKLAQQQLVQSEERLRTVLDNIETIVYVVSIGADESLHSQVPFVSNPVKSILGYDPSEFINDPQLWAKAIHPEDLNVIGPQTMDIIAKGKPATRMYRMLSRLDGSYRWVEDRVIPRMNAQGRVTSLFGVASDITERKAAEDRLERLTRLYALLYSTNEMIVRARSQDELFERLCSIAVEHGRLHRAVVRLDAEQSGVLRAVAFSEAARPIAERPLVSNDPGLPDYHWPGAVAYREGRLIIDNDRSNSHVGLYFKDKGLGTGSTAALPLRRSGEVIGVVLLVALDPNYFDAEMGRLLEQMANDVSFALDNFEREAQRLRAERGLAESEERYRGLVEQSISGICIIEDGRYIYVNPRYAEIFGYTPEELKGQSALTVVAEEDRALVAENVRLRESGEALKLQYVFSGVRKDGARISVGVHGTRGHIEGRPVAIAIVQDISERERAQAQIHAYIGQLEQAMLGTVQAVSTIVEMRDPYTAGHEKRVGALARAIGEELGLPEEACRGLEISGAVHDIGKIAVPSEILSKPGKLSEIEFSLIKAHPQLGHDVLARVAFPWPLATTILQHHERLDGTGYPAGLKGDAIILEARIMAVADVVEAIASHRPYRATLGIEVALDEITKFRGVRYDAQVVDACLRLFQEKGYTLPS